MMELPNLDQRFNVLHKKNYDFTNGSLGATNDIIDAQHLDVVLRAKSEEWLVESLNKSESDLYRWMYDLDAETSSPPKNIDSRTFTRPKKRFTRPSVEKYNEELYGGDFSLQEMNLNSFNASAESETNNKPLPLHFDLAQPSSSFYFDNILANSGMADSFQNMSPPSLANSMCSSTFANLMENSFIQNDPDLKEIRDTDYTESIILQQETEPLYQSINGSWSSLNSDVPENFLKKISLNETFKRNFMRSDGTFVDVPAGSNATFNKYDVLEKSKNSETITISDTSADNPLDQTLTPETKPTTPNKANGTYLRNSRTKSTFTISDVNSGSIKTNATFQRRKKPEIGNTPSPNSSMSDTERDILLKVHDTDSKETFTKSTENIKRLLDRRPSPSMDLNRLNYPMVNGEDQQPVNTTFTHTTNENNIKNTTNRNSYGSTESPDNLDYMSLSSGSSSSAPNNKVLSMDGLNAIVEMQERSLRAVSTPKVGGLDRLWDEGESRFAFSPISGRNSDPELSSSSGAATGPPTLAGIGQLSKQAPVRASQPNLKLLDQRTISRPFVKRPAPTGRSNLNSMGRTLKGSYTSLKPMNPNLPVAPPLNTTVTRTRADATFTAPPVSVAQFAKSQPKVSGLPRPTTGIPRPASRIPGPRSLSNRPIAKPTGQQ